MLQKEVFPNYRRDCADLAKIYEILKSLYNDTYVDELCTMRGYVGDEQKALITQMKLGYCSIEDISGNLCSLIGYYADYKKYITLPTDFFSKQCQFFNFKQAYELSWKEYGGYVILVEGIFDCLSLRAIGLPAIATMGATVSSIKGELLKLFRKVLAIPDDDEVGRKALNRYSINGWKVPSNTTFLKFYGGLFDVGGLKIHCKDMDNFVSWYDANDVRDILLSYRDSTEDIEELHIA